MSLTENYSWITEAEQPTGSAPPGPTTPAPSQSPFQSPFRSEAHEGYEAYEDQLDAYEGELAPATAPMGATASTTLDSPFRTAGRETEHGTMDAEDEAVRELLSELYEDELEESLAELLEETAAVHAEAEAALVGRPDSEAVEEPVREWLEPLAEQTEDMLESLAEAVGTADAHSLTEDEVEALFESALAALPAAQPARPAPLSSPGGQSPAFEHFFKAIGKFAKKAAKGAVKLVKKGAKAVRKLMPMSLIMHHLKKLVRPILKRVLKVGIKRLPRKLRPIASKIAKRVVREAPQTEAEQAESLAYAPTAHLLGEDPEATAPSPAAELALEVAGATAGLILSGGGQEGEDWLAEAATVISGEALDAEDLEYEQELPAAEIQALDEARERFTEALAQLPEGGNPEPALEEFLPAVMAVLPVIRKIVSAIGREKVIRLLSGLLAKLIGKWVKGRNAQILSRAVVETGFKLLKMEAEDESPQRTAAATMTAVVEETVRQLSQLPAEELEDPVRLQIAAGKAFNAATAAHVPSTLLREDLEELEARDVKGVWVPMPRTKPHRFRYKRYSRSFDVTLDTRQAAALRTAKGVPLSVVLRDKHRVAKFPVRLRVHLYESLPGTLSAQIRTLERKRARGGSNPVVMLPLTKKVAGALLGNPGFGRDGKRPVKGRALPPGTRLIGIELVEQRPGPQPGGAAPAVPGARPVSREDEQLARVRPSAAAKLRKPTGVQLTVDTREGRERLTVALHLAEARAQSLLRDAGTPPQLAPFLAGLTTDLAQGTVTALLAPQGRKVRIFREAYEQSVHLSPADEGEELVASLAPRVRDGLTNGIKRAASQALTEFFKGRLTEFVRAVQSPEDGVTVVVTLPGAPLAGVIASIRSGKVPSLAVLSRAIGAASATQSAKVVVQPGFHRG